MNKHTFAYLLMIIFLSNCTISEKSKPTPVEFSSTQEIEWDTLKELPIDEIPSNIMIEDSLLIVANKEGEHLFQIYCKNSLELLKSFGNKGRGPDEFTTPELTEQVIHEEDKPYHLVYDWNTNKITFINFQDYISDTIVVSENRELASSFRGGDMVYYSDSLIIMAAKLEEDKGRFKIEKDNKIQTIDYLPKLYFDVHENNRHSVYVNASSTVNPNKHKFVATANLLGQYDFFDMQGNHLHSTVINWDDSLEKSSSSESILNSPIMHYGWVLQSTDDLIFADYTQVSNLGEFSNSEIHILNWIGEALVRLKTNKVVSSIAIDEQDQAIYGIAYDKESFSFSIVKFNYQELDLKSHFAKKIDRNNYSELKQ